MVSQKAAELCLAMYKLTISCRFGAETIQVDTRNPERNGGLEIFEVSDIEKVRAVRPCFRPANCSGSVAPPELMPPT